MCKGEQLGPFKITILNKRQNQLLKSEDLITAICVKDT